MPQHYLLPCPHCGQSLTIEPAQAGQELECHCGSPLMAPTFREMRHLEPADTAAPDEPSAAWSQTQGVMFSLGVLVLIVALGLGFFPVRWRSQISLKKPPPPDMSHYNWHIDEMTPLETLAEWESAVTFGANRAGPPPHIAMRPTATLLNVLIVVAAVAAIAGLSSAIAAFFMSPRRPPTKSR